MGKYILFSTMKISISYIITFSLRHTVKLDKEMGQILDLTLCAAFVAEMAYKINSTKQMKVLLRRENMKWKYAISFAILMGL